MDAYQRLCSYLADMKSVVLAFSGGVDSSLLLFAVRDTPNLDCLAVTVDSPFCGEHEREDAQSLATQLGVAHQVVILDELEHESVRNNSADRCYHCKRLRFLALLQIAQQRSSQTVVIEGSNHDDLSDYRPGLWAVRELGIRSPLLELGWTKQSIRQQTRKLGLAHYDRAQAACLASRIPYGQPISRKMLQQVSRAEQVLRDLGLDGALRVRHHQSVARIEVPPENISFFLAEGVRQQVVERFRKLGFLHVALDLAGYRQGALNEELITAP